MRDHTEIRKIYLFSKGFQPITFAILSYTCKTVPRTDPLVRSIIQENICCFLKLFLKTIKFSSIKVTAHSFLYKSV